MNLLLNLIYCTKHHYIKISSKFCPVCKSEKAINILSKDVYELNDENEDLASAKEELAIQVAALQNRENEWKMLGTVEIMAENPHVSEYIENLEDRNKALENRIVEILKTPW